MAETNEQDTIETLRNELSKLRQQLENIVKTAEDKKNEVSGDIIDRLTKELEQLRNSARSQAHKLYETGQYGCEEVSEKVRQNPVASLLIAFGAGCVISCLFRHLR